MKEELLEKLKRGDILVCDGAMGTMLQAKGLGTGECPDLWNLTNPGVVSSIHRSYLDVGADLIITNTFGANRLKLKRFGKEADTRQINLHGARLAKKEAEGKAMVLGDVGPTGEFLEPVGTIKLEELYETFKAQVLALVDGGVDAIIVETMSDLREAETAVRAAKENASLPVIGCMTFQKGKYGFRTLMGNEVERVVKGLESIGCDVIGSNCGTGLSEMIEIICQMRDLTELPLIAEPNAGLPRLVEGRTVYDETPEFFYSKIPDLLKAGARIIGGCCGTTPKHIAEIVKVVKRW